MRLEALRRALTAGLTIAAVVVVGGAVAGAHGGNSDPKAIHACIHKQNGSVRIVGPEGVCTRGEHARHWAITGPQGPPGTDGIQGQPGEQGAPGQQGPAGPAGVVLLAHHTWSTSSTAGALSYTALTGSDFPATTNGGLLLIQISVHMRDFGPTPVVPDQIASCAPFIDDQWAGDYGALPKAGVGLDLFEGATQTTRTSTQFGWRQWNTTRIYPGVPAGAHVIDVRCRTNTGSVGVNATPSPFVPSYVSVLEMPQ